MVRTAAAAVVMPLTRQLRPVGPHKLLGKVVEGFKRGSKEVRLSSRPISLAAPAHTRLLVVLQLGWPTANLDPAAFESTLDSEEEGVYVGWATLEDGHGGALPPAARVAHKAVLSIGWNPTFHNEKRTVEAYLCHEFDRDFYGASMRLIVCGYVRPQARAHTVSPRLSLARARQHAQICLGLTRPLAHRITGGLLYRGRGVRGRDGDPHRGHCRRRRVWEEPARDAGDARLPERPLSGELACVLQHLLEGGCTQTLLLLKTV